MVLMDSVGLGMGWIFLFKATERMVSRRELAESSPRSFKKIISVYYTISAHINAPFCQALVI